MTQAICLVAALACDLKANLFAIVASWLFGKIFLEQLWVLEYKVLSSLGLLMILFGFLTAMFWLV